jgi:hypothetical protein
MATYCYVPGECEQRSVHLPVPRTGRCITAPAWVAADCSHVKLGVVITRPTFESALVAFGLSREKIEV